MLRPVDEYFFKQQEPAKTCLLFLRENILHQHPLITEEWKYGMPFYCYNKKMFCYLWMHKKYKQPYIGFVNGKLIDDPDLLLEKRARMKILLIDPNCDIPLKKINRIVKKAIELCISSG